MSGLKFSSSGLMSAWPNPSPFLDVDVLTLEFFSWTECLRNNIFVLVSLNQYKYSGSINVVVFVTRIITPTIKFNYLVNLNMDIL